MNTHIFKTYEEALDYMEAHPDEYISWHVSEIAYIGDGKFRAYEQELSYDGVNCYDVINILTREDLLNRVKRHKDWFEEKYPEEKGKQWWLSDDGVLDNVYIYTH